MAFSCPMRTISLMSCIPNSPDLTIFCPAHPTPFFPTSNWSWRAFNMVTSVHFLNPTTAKAGFRVRFEPESRLFVGCEMLIADANQILRTSEIRMSRCTTLKARYEFACWTSEM